MLKIRPFAIEDYDTVISLWQTVNLPFRPEGRDSKENIGRQINNNATFFLVAETGGSIIGTVMGTHDSRKGWINRLAVAPAYRRKGIARQLVKTLEREFDKYGLDVTACLIEADNKASMEFFKEVGYAEWSGKYFSKRKDPGA